MGGPILLSYRCRGRHTGNNAGPIYCLETFQFQSAEKRQTPPPSADQSALAPNYLRHPAIGYKVDVTDIPEEDDGNRGERVAANDASNHATFAGKKKPPPPSFRILKARIIKRAE